MGDTTPAHRRRDSRSTSKAFKRDACVPEACLRKASTTTPSESEPSDAAADPHACSCCSSLRGGLDHSTLSNHLWQSVRSARLKLDFSHCFCALLRSILRSLQFQCHRPDAVFILDGESIEGTH